MGPITAIASCYVNILNFSGRARRAEYWWFFLFLVLAGIAAQIALVGWIMGDASAMAALQDPDRAQVWFKEQENLVAYGGYGFAVYLVLAWLPQLSVTVRRLHDTDRSGWYILMPFAASIAAVVAGIFIALAMGPESALPLILLVSAVPLLANIWLLVVLCLPGSHGNNRFGPDPVKGRKRRAPDHPAFARPADPEEREALASARRAEIKDYYRKTVLPNTRRAGT